MPRVPLALTPIADREQLSVLLDGLAEMSFVRLPVDRDGLRVIPLYRETSVVVVPKGHPVAAFEEVSVADLADEHLLQDPDTVPEWSELAAEVLEGTRVDVPAMTPKEAIEVVASGVGIVIVPKSVARLYNRKDVTHRPVTALAESQVGLAWLADATDTRIDTFIGIVRGRTERSSRAGETPAPEQRAAKKAAAKKVAAQSKKQVHRPVGARGTRSARGGRADGRRNGGR